MKLSTYHGSSAPVACAKLCSDWIPWVFDTKNLCGKWEVMKPQRLLVKTAIESIYFSQGDINIYSTYVSLAWVGIEMLKSCYIKWEAQVCIVLWSTIYQLKYVRIFLNNIFTELISGDKNWL